MKNKKGFTLIELLAVIVILAIIALIATPIVMNVIENSRKGAAERSADNYIDAVEIAVAAERIEGKTMEGEYIIQTDGHLCPVAGCGENDDDKVKIDINGNKPEPGGTILIQNGQVVDELIVSTASGTETKTTLFNVKGYEVSYNEKGELKATKQEQEEEDKPKFSGTVYRHSAEPINILDTIDASDTEQFKTNPLEIEEDFYLKHVVENDIVTESYACARQIINDDEIVETCLRGGSSDFYGYAEDEANYTGNLLILKDTGNEYCSFSAEYTQCLIAGPDGDGETLMLVAIPEGSSYTGSNFDQDYFCLVNLDGYSSCDSYE